MQIFQTKWFARWAASEGLLELKDMAFFLYGFAKNQRDNIDDKELQALKRMAAHLLAYDRNALETAIKTQELIQVTYE